MIVLNPILLISALGSEVPAREHDSVFWMRVGHIQVTYTKRFIDQLLEWVMDFTRAKVLPDPAHAVVIVAHGAK